MSRLLSWWERVFSLGHVKSEMPSRFVLCTSHRGLMAGKQTDFSEWERLQRSKTLLKAARKKLVDND